MKSSFYNNLLASMLSVKQISTEHWAFLFEDCTEMKKHSDDTTRTMKKIFFLLFDIFRLVSQFLSNFSRQWYCWWEYEWVWQSIRWSPWSGSRWLQKFFNFNFGFQYFSIRKLKTNYQSQRQFSGILSCLV